MYKIFMNEIPVVIREGNPVDAEGVTDRHNPVYFFTRQKEIREAFDRAESGVYIRSLTIIGEDAKQIMQTLFKGYRSIEAAGGVVVNKEGSILLIYRHSMWDLPKGKLDAGEVPGDAALREIEEETGLRKLKLEEPICKTYHTYVAISGGRVLKKTYWYLVSHSGKGQTKPQAEEGIEAAVWVDPDMLGSKMERTYGNIRDVIDKALIKLHLLPQRQEQDGKNSPGT
jgi:8-oxo-dGTP pyrophosphatase MutT (NUDIX family)